MEKNKEVQAKMRTEIVQLCKEQYGMNYESEDITDCDGCRTEGEKLFSASKSCPIRKCAREKEIENCAYCTEYACGKIEAFFKTDPTAKKRLDEIRRKFPVRTLSNSFPIVLPVFQYLVMKANSSKPVFPALVRECPSPSPVRIASPTLTGLSFFPS